MPEPSPDKRSSLPAHPDRVDDAEPPAEAGSWGAIFVVALLAGLFVVVVVLPLTGVVGPGSH